MTVELLDELHFDQLAAQALFADLVLVLEQTCEAFGDEADLGG